MDSICFPSPCKSFDNDPTYHWWVAYSDGKPIGYAGLYIQTKGLEAHFERCGVLPMARGNGVQRRLIKARLSWCRRSGIKVVQTYTSGPGNKCGVNYPSVANLKACGFKARQSRGGGWIRFKMRL